MKRKACILGAGNSAHVTAGLIASLPDFSARYLSEDVPHNMVPVKGLAELCGVQTPTIDQLLEWCQRVMGKEYLVNGKLTGNDVAETFAPQRYGFTTLEAIPELK